MSGARPRKSLRCVALACVVFAGVAFGERDAQAQGRDGLLNGVAVGAIGAGIGLDVDALLHRVAIVPWFGTTGGA